MTTGLMLDGWKPGGHRPPLQQTRLYYVICSEAASEQRGVRRASGRLRGIERVSRNEIAAAAFGVKFVLVYNDASPIDDRHRPAANLTTFIRRITDVIVQLFPMNGYFL